MKSNKKFTKQKSAAKQIVQELDKAMGFDLEEGATFYNKNLQEQTFLLNKGINNLSLLITEKFHSQPLLYDHVIEKLKSYDFKSIYSKYFKYLSSKRKLNEIEDINKLIDRSYK
jgi:hypothetical protein